ncbi:J domain-containing protein [Arthrobacter sp. ISL-30]|uniref:J domain-containing protein n=1 Tax=Arthrobacter sp. ISL-30 TaxID=2819109 RepID=UPI0020358B5F|nr:J domain-containing protein [Arthrobacter sp. ISL-30]
MTQATVTHYEVLGVPTTAHTAEIKKAYQRRLRTSHPDTGGSTGLFRLLQEAYEVLSDPAGRRAAYDSAPGHKSSGNPGGASGQRSQQERSRPQPDSSQQKPESAFADMEQPPAPPTWTGPAVEYRPSLVPPSGERPKIRQLTSLDTHLAHRLPRLRQRLYRPAPVQYYLVIQHCSVKPQLVGHGASLAPGHRPNPGLEARFGGIPVEASESVKIQIHADEGGQA